MRYCIPSSKLHTAEVLIPQFGDLAQGIQGLNFVVQLRTLCDSFLYAQLSKVAVTAENDIIWIFHVP